MTWGASWIASRDDRHGSVRAVAVPPDGRILIGGVFQSVLDVERTNLARLNPDGSLDHNFNPPPAFATRMSGYAIGFFLFWLISALSSLLTLYLARTARPDQ